MKILEIVGDNYSGYWNRVRNASRGIVMREGRILMTRQSLTDTWMIPGGGLEKGETWADCVRRELAEETGYEVSADECVLEIHEYYEDCRYVSRYFRCTVTGETGMSLTEAEAEAGAEPVWADPEEVTGIFSEHARYAASDEMKRGLYLREYTALMQIRHSRDGETKVLDEELELVPYYPAEYTALQWYQDPVLCRQVDNIDHVYDIGLLRRMYSYLSAHGDCFYIRYRGKLIGDCSLRDDGEIAVVICREYQNRHIGRRCVSELIRLGREKGLSRVSARIYPFNEQSRNMFRSAGFTNETGDIWIYDLKNGSQEG